MNKSLVYRLINTDRPTDPNNAIYQEAVEFFLKRLLKGKKITKKVLRVDIKAHAHMYDMGQCFFRKLKNGEIVYRVKFQKNLTFFETIATLAHESVHVVQFLTGRARYTKLGNWWWDNTCYGVDPYANVEKDEDLPWEKEAWNKEKKLRKEFLIHYIDNRLN